MSFEHLGLAPELVRVVADEGYSEPTPVQRAAIPVVLAGRDVLAAAQTGTGKTAAFVLPILQRLAAVPVSSGSPAAGPVPSANGQRRRPIRALVLTPTRELALQVEASVKTYGRHRPVRSVAIYGGVGFDAQVRALRSGPTIVVATPGRLLDHVGQGTIDLGAVEILVLDEADRMLDMGFIRDIRRVIDLLPRTRQNLLFSATFSTEIRTLAEGFLDRPATIDVAPRNAAADLVDQLVIPVDRHRKRELLVSLIRSGRVGQALVFARTKHGANKLAEQLVRDGVEATAIHGNKSQGQRVRALDDFKAGRVDVLVATDIAARGIDIDALPYVVNYELPMVASDYVHRIGRTGRAGVDGRAISLVCVDEAGLLREIERLLGRTIPSEVVVGFEPDRFARPEPIRLRSGEMGRTQGGATPMRRPAGPARPARPEPAARSSRPLVGHSQPSAGQWRPNGGRPQPSLARTQSSGARPQPNGGRPQPSGVRPHRNGGRPQPSGVRHDGSTWSAPHGGSRVVAQREPVRSHYPLVPMPGERLSKALRKPSPTGARGED